MARWGSGSDVFDWLASARFMTRLASSLGGGHGPVARPGSLVSGSAGAGGGGAAGPALGADVDGEGVGATAADPLEADAETVALGVDATGIARAAARAGGSTPAPGAHAQAVTSNREARCRPTSLRTPMDCPFIPVRASKRGSYRVSRRPRPA